MTSSDSVKNASKAYYHRNRDSQSKVRLTRYRENKFAFIWDKWLHDWDYLAGERKRRCPRVRKPFTN